MFTAKDMQCTVSRHHESGYTRNKSSLEVRLGNLCDKLTSIDLIMIEMNKCIKSASSLVMRQWNEDPLKLDCMEAIVGHF